VAVYSFIRQHGQPDVRILPMHPLPDTVSAEVSYFQNILQSWIHAFNSFFSLLENIDAETSLGSNVLMVQYYITQIKVSTCFLLDEMIYDQYLPQFEEIVDRSEKVINAENDPWLKSRGPCFTLDIAMAQPLYFLARKCQDPQLRRRAVELMKKVGREGIYTGRTVAKVAEWIICAEEGRDCAQGFVSTEC
jgi:hypothetical protein